MIKNAAYKRILLILFVICIVSASIFSAPFLRGFADTNNTSNNISDDISTDTLHGVSGSSESGFSDNVSRNISNDVLGCAKNNTSYNASNDVLNDVSDSAASGVLDSISENSANKITGVLESEMGLEPNTTIKWVDLNVSSKILKDVYNLSLKYYNTDTEFNFVEVLAYIATKNGNKFVYSADKKTLSKLVKELENGKTVTELIKDNKYYKYYYACYDAIFKEYVGEYILENDETQTVRFGLKTYFPLAKGYWFNHYDDFGSSRSYGFKRVHLGHDMFGSTGAPVIAIEGGVIEEMGWNRFGGWRIGIRSLDKNRYYYYAHLRKGRPFAAGLKAGDTVTSGQVIGYLGATGYSTTEDVNLKTGKPHLHWGLQLIFDDGERECLNEIWIDVYALTDFLLSNRAQTIKVDNKEHKSVNLKKSLNKVF